MEDQIIKILKSFKSIGPDEGFVKRSRQLILSAPQKIKNTFFFSSKASFLESFKLATTVALAGALLFIILGGVSVFNAKITNFQPMFTDLDSKNLKSAESGFDIKLGQITYDLDSEKDIGAKIDEALDSLSL